MRSGALPRLVEGFARNIGRPAGVDLGVRLADCREMNNLDTDPLCLPFAKTERRN